MPSRRRSRRSKKASVKQVKAIVKKEVGKTRELQKMLSYVGWSRMNDLLVTAGGLNADEICLFSLTGGLNPVLASTQDPQSYVAKNLFSLLPAQYTVLGGTLDGVGQAGQGGTSSQMDGGGGTVTSLIGNVHQLEGRECYLKTFYATIGINNGTAGVVTPTNSFVRAMVIETRRPLGSNALSQQILCQNHAVPAMNAAIAPAAYPVSSFGYVNRDVVKKIHFNKLINLNAGSGATGSMRSFRIKISINKKARWSYYYDTRDPASPGEKLTYQGPYLYFIMWPSETNVYGTAWNDDGIPADRQPRFALNSLLTFYDD